MPVRARGCDLSVANPGNNQNSLIKHIIGNKSDGFEGNTLYSLGKEQDLEIHHETFIFPTVSNVNVVFTAGLINAYGAWAEIVDGGAVTLSSQLTRDAHFSAVIIEEASIVDQVYIIEISHGVALTNIARIRFIAGERVFLPPIQMMKIRATIIPAGQTVYYRMMAETGGATANISFRYHFH